MTTENLCHDCDSYQRMKAQRDELAAALEELIATSHEVRDENTVEFIQHLNNAENQARAALAKVKAG